MDTTARGRSPGPPERQGRRGSRRRSAVGRGGSPTDPAGLDAALRRVGDRWAPLVLSELADGGATFGELSERLAGIAPNVLTKRLRALEAEGLITSVPYQDRPVRVRYQLSDTGRQLGGVWAMLGEWGAAHLPDGGAVSAPSHGACGADLELRWYCPTCDEVVDRDHDDTVHL